MKHRDLIKMIMLFDEEEQRDKTASIDEDEEWLEEDESDEEDDEEWLDN